MTDPFLEARQLQEQAKAEGVDVFEILAREQKETPKLEVEENPFIDVDENGVKYHDRPERDYE